MKLSEDMKELYDDCLEHGWENFNRHDYKRFVDQVELLESENENLKCCGNCLSFMPWRLVECDLKQNCKDYKNKYEYCDEWQWDQLNRKDRMK
jgi:hypothetical protein